MESHLGPITAPSSFSPPSPAEETAPESLDTTWSHRLLFFATLLVIGLPLALTARFVWGEWRAFQDEERRVSASAVVGYPNIYPNVSWALRPDPWFRVEGDSVLVWAGWRQGKGHQWFRVNRGELERQQLGDPLGRDVCQAIDYPVIENGGGTIWERIPEAAAVAGLSLGGCSCAYPMGVMMKVLIVNDVVQDEPYLVYFDPFVRPSAKVAVYDARVDGHRITLGSSGLILNGRLVLYDRGTESLWVDDGRGLTSIAGKYKGKSLSLVCRIDPVSWDDWRDDHPGARLVVGSLDRKRALPSE